MNPRPFFLRGFLPPNDFQSWCDTEPVVMEKEPQFIQLHRVTEAEYHGPANEGKWDALLAVGIVVGIAGSFLQPWLWFA